MFAVHLPEGMRVEEYARLEPAANSHSPGMRESTVPGSPSPVTSLESSIQIHVRPKGALKALRQLISPRGPSAPYSDGPPAHGQYWA